MSSLLDLHLLNSILMILIGILFGVIIARRFKLTARLWWIGAAGFVLSQVGHIPFNALVTQLFAQGTLPAPGEGWKNLFNAAFLGLSAGLFEELTRAAIYRWWAKDARSWRKGVLFGSGWGGIEAIIFGALALATFFNMVVIRGTDLSAVVPPEQLALAQQQVETYWGATPLMRMLGAFERLATVPIHIAMSVIVLQAFIRRGSRIPGWGWVALAVLWHAVIDAVAVYLGQMWMGQTWGMYALEGVVALMSLISIGFIFALRTPEPIEAQPVFPAAPAPKTAAELLAEEPDVETQTGDLDSSRFSS